MDFAQLTAQRNLYRLFLELPEVPAEQIDEQIQKGLELVVKICGAHLGYLEVCDEKGQGRWSAYQCSDQKIHDIQTVISSGIIATAIGEGRTVSTPSAFLDRRFADHESVRTGRIEAVLCAPVGCGDRMGAIYLQGDSSFSSSSHENLMEAELFTRHVGPLLQRFGSLGTPADIVLERADLTDIIGDSEAFRSVLREALAVSHMNVPVLLTGETGTGKTLLAKTIHRNSHRRDAPFVHLNCANLPEQLIESELFGAVKGSHSGAHRDMPGKLGAAGGGTLFLDEIGELPYAVQAKFLQFIEEGFYYPLGADTPEFPDVRILAASHIDFDQEISRKCFRADLYYRINVFSLEVPPLRDRASDILELTRFFVAKYCAKYGIPQLAVPDDLSFLCNRPWPGNIRQLENSIQQAILVAHTTGAPAIAPGHLRSPGGANETLMEQKGTYLEEKERWEERLVREKLDENGWNVSLTARQLGLSRSHLNNLIKQYGIIRPELRM